MLGSEARGSDNMLVEVQKGNEQMEVVEWKNKMKKARCSRDEDERDVAKAQVDKAAAEPRQCQILISAMGQRPAKRPSEGLKRLLESG